MNQTIKRTLLAACASSLTIMMAGQAISGEVILDSLEEDITLSGKLIAIDAENYTVLNEHGTFIVPASKVSCKGSVCPVIVSQNDTLDLINVSGIKNAASRLATAN